MTHSLLRRPAFWLTALALLSGVASFAKHRFQPIVEPDTASYQNFDWSSPAAIFSHIRTPGYPLFLQLVTSVTRQPMAVPLVHWLVWLGVGVWLHRGLCRIGFRPGVAVWPVGALWLGHATLDLTPELLSDSLGCALSLAAMGAFWRTLGRDRRIADWCWLSLFTIAAYLVRPVYLGLIPLWAVLALWLRGGRFPSLDPSCKWYETAVRYLIITLIPFAAYSTIRWCSVGHWGLVSFGGYNSVAIAAQFLEADDLERLPTNLRPLATEILSRIEQTPDVEPRTSFESLERNYIRLQYPVILAAATDVVGREPVRLNHELTRLSSELFRQHPKEYVRWLLWNLRHAVKQSLLLTISDPAVLGLTGLGFALLAFQLFLPSLRPSERVATSDLVPASRQATLEVHVLWWSALGLAAAQTALIILVQPAIGRYMLSAIVLIPSALATQLGTQLGVWNRQSDSAGNRRS